MRGTKIVNCNCPQPFQDARYGKGKRVANAMACSKTDKPKYRCATCSKVHEN